MIQTINLDDLCQRYESKYFKFNTGTNNIYFKVDKVIKPGPNNLVHFFGESVICDIRKEFSCYGYSYGEMVFALEYTDEINKEEYVDALRRSCDIINNSYTAIKLKQN